LLLPCWWGLGLAALSDGRFGLADLWIGLGCAAGAFLMRGAGCTWNDITDREFDAQVARTRSRPIPSGQVSARGAAAWMIAQALIAFAILLTFNSNAIILGVISLLPVAVYPFAKRFTWWPQVFLGIAWTLFYDTIYAHQDTEDDALIGVKSTARLFGEASPRWLRRFLVVAVALLGGAALLAVIDRSVLSLVLALGGVWAFGWHLAWQLGRFDPDSPERLLMLFRSNRNAGLIPVLFFAVAFFV